jgi:hypothetical protein
MTGFVASCHRCQMNDPNKLQTYEVADSKRGLRLLINVTAAYAFARLNLTAMEIPVDYVQKMVLVNMSETFCGAHVEHVDRTKPAIVGIFENDKEVAMLLLDGTHRMFGSVKHGEPAMAYVLEPSDLLRFVIERTAI